MIDRRAFLAKEGSGLEIQHPASAEDPWPPRNLAEHVGIQDLTPILD